MIELVIGLVTYFMTDGTFGDKVINIADNLNIFYGILLAFSIILGIFFALVGAGVGAGVSKKPAINVVAGLAGAGGGLILGLIFASINILRFALTYYIESNANPEATQFADFSQNVNYAIIILGIIWLYYLFKKNSSDESKTESKSK